jgi:hypothetical protein
MYALMARVNLWLLVLSIPVHLPVYWHEGSNQAEKCFAQCALKFISNMYWADTIKCLRIIGYSKYTLSLQNIP